MNKSNSVAVTIKTLAWIVIIVGLIEGIIAGKTYDIFQNEEKYDISLMIPYWVDAFIYGILLMGLGEIIGILHSIKYNFMKVHNLVEEPEYQMAPGQQVSYQAPQQVVYQTPQQVAYQTPQQVAYQAPQQQTQNIDFSKYQLLMQIKSILYNDREDHTLDYLKSKLDYRYKADIPAAEIENQLNELIRQNIVIKDDDIYMYNRK